MIVNEREISRVREKEKSNMKVGQEKNERKTK